MYVLSCFHNKVVMCNTVRFSCTLVSTAVHLWQRVGWKCFPIQWWSLLKLHEKLHRCIFFQRSCHRNHRLLNTAFLIQESVWCCLLLFFCLIPTSILFWPSKDCRSISKTAYSVFISEKITRNSSIKSCISHLYRVLTCAIANT